MRVLLPGSSYSCLLSAPLLGRLSAPYCRLIRRQNHDLRIRLGASLAEYAVLSQKLIATASDLSRLAVKEEP